MSNETFIGSVKYELLCEAECKNMQKDILIVVHDQLPHLEECIDSICEHTVLYHLYIWDNNSDKRTQDYLKALNEEPYVDVYFHDSNEGFIRPNNRLLEMGTSPYVILLNSDTIVEAGWDLAMLGYLQKHPDVMEVGYLGGRLASDGTCAAPVIGASAEYIMGWCACLPRNVFVCFDLFDEKNLIFAYGEDSDLSLRLREAGHEIHALHVQHVEHFGNVTASAVQQERDLKESYLANLAYLRDRWTL